MMMLIDNRNNWNTLNIVDVFSLLFLFLLVLLGFNSDTLESQKVLYSVLSLGTLYIVVRSLFLLNRGLMQTVVIAVIALSCLYETIGGFRDLLLRHTPSPIPQYGSFYNSGPLGGYIAVCASLLVAYAYTIKNKTKRMLSLIVAIPALILLPSTFSRASILALLISMSLLAASTGRGRALLKKHYKWLIPVLLLLFTGAYLIKKPSADGRLFMNRICIRSIQNNKFTGAGLGRYCGAYGEAQFDFFDSMFREGLSKADLSSFDKKERLMADCPENGFNEFIKMGVEGGPLAAVLFLGLIVTAIVVSLKSGDIWHYGLLTVAVFACFSYPMTYWLFRVLIVVILAAISGSAGETGAKGGILVMSSSLIVMIILLVKIFPGINAVKQADRSYKDIHYLYSFNKYNGVTSEHEKLLPYLTSNATFLFDYGKSLSASGNYEKSDSILKLGTRISSDPMFWNIMGNNSLALGRYREAEERYMHAFLMVPNRLYPLCLLTKLYYAEGDYERARKMAKMVMEFKPKVESTTTKELRNEIADLITGIPDGL